MTSTPRTAPGYSSGATEAPRIRCSFCNKDKDDVRLIVSGPEAFICNECIDTCIDILETQAGMKIRSAEKAPPVDLASLGIKPRFKTLRFDVRDDHCFHLCPFSEPFNTVYNDHVVKAVKAAGFTIERADEVFGTDPIIEDIWQSINSAAVITADVTGRNPNVMYEIGMAHTVGKPVIILTQTMNDVPFDLKHYRCVVYDYTPRGCAMLEERLLGTLRFLKGKRSAG